MTTGSALIGTWASGVWQDLGSPSALSALTISGYAIQPSTLGRLNVLIGTCYQSTGHLVTGTIFNSVPDLTNTELSLIEGLFRVSYYNQLAMAMMGSTQAGIGWESIKEGDTTIRRGSPTNIGKEYREMAKDTQVILNRLVNAYHTEIQSSSTPRDVAFLNPSYPSIAFPYSNPYGGAYWRG